MASEARHLEVAGRAQMVALARLAARHGVVCGGTDVDATLEALRARIDAARAEGDARLATALVAGIAEATGAED